MSSKTADISAQIAQQRERLTETVGALAEKIDTQEIADTLRERATAGAGELRETANTKTGKRNLLVGAVLAIAGLLLVRRLLG